MKICIDIFIHLIYIYIYNTHIHTLLLITHTHSNVDCPCFQARFVHLCCPKEKDRKFLQKVFDRMDADGSGLVTFEDSLRAYVNACDMSFLQMIDNIVGSNFRVECRLRFAPGQ